MPSTYSRAAAREKGENDPTAMKSVVVDPGAYDWEGDRPLRRSSAQTLVYEMHVRGFTMHPSSGLPEATRGTYAGVIEKIPYLRELGVTAVELLPVFQFDALDCPAGHVNYWGYAPVSFFAPHQAYSSRPDPLGAVDEFRDMVKALHRAGIEVILDVVFNHTAEGDHLGPTICFRGLEDKAYYLLEGDESRYANYTGTGNTLNANHPVVRRLILDSLRYWVQEMHVDGFRFDLGVGPGARFERGTDCPNRRCCGTSIRTRCCRARSSSPKPGTPQGCIRSAASSATPGRSGTAISATTSEVSSAETMARSGQLAERLLGSPDVYGHKQREAEASVNFVTCHDGFTLNDLVSYNEKHNEANGEGNRDGANDNRSWNCGVEGPTDDPAIEKAPQSSGEELPDADDAVARHADAADGRRSPANAMRATTTPTARTTRRAGSTGRC